MKGRKHIPIWVLGCAALLQFFGTSLADEPGSWYRDGDLKVSFFYSDKFAPREPAETTTIFVVNWLAAKTEGIVATCYLKALPSDHEPEAARAYIQANPEAYAESWRTNTLRRAKVATILTFRSVYADGLPAVFIEMDSVSETFDGPIELRTYSLITYWNGHEIILECGTSVPSIARDELTEEKADIAITNVEEEIMRTIRSLHFQRH